MTDQYSVNTFQALHGVYISTTGAYLSGSPITNEERESLVGGQPPRYR